MSPELELLLAKQTWLPEAPPFALREQKGGTRQACFYLLKYGLFSERAVTQATGV